MQSQLFTKPDVWNGGYFELAIEINPPSDSHLISVLRSIWQQPKLQGCYLDREVEPSGQKQINHEMLTLETPSLQTHLQGVATLPNDCKVACGTCFIREPDGSDWLVFYLPMGSLVEAYDVGGYPFGPPDMLHKEWQEPLEKWLASMGESVYEVQPFSLGLIGFEVSGEAYADTISTEGIPEKRVIGYLWPSGSRVEHYPSNFFSWYSAE